MMQYRFTPREQDVAELLMQGMRQVDIAKRLVIDTETVRYHERNIIRKMKTRTRFEAALKLCLMATLQQQAAPQNN